MINLLTGHPKVDAIAQINFEGDVTPKSWYKHICYQTPKGEQKADRLAIDILSDIVYWYRPYQKRDEITGEFIGWKKKFAEKLLRRSPDAFAETLNASVRCVRESMRLLEHMGLIEVVLQPVKTPYGVIPNVMHIDINPDAIAGITHRPNNQESAETLEKSLLTKWVMPNDETVTNLRRNRNQPTTKPLSPSDEIDHSSIYRDFSRDFPETTSPLTPLLGEAPPEPGAPPTQERGCVVEEEVSQEGDGNDHRTKDSQSITLATKQDLISIQEKSIVSGKDKNSAVACDNSAFIGHGNIAPDGKTRVFNQTSGKWQSCSSDPWMKGCNPDRAFKQWVCDRAVAAGKKYCLADASGEIRNNFQRAGDLWEEYQDEQTRRVEVEQIKQPAAEPAVAEQTPPRKNNQFQFYRSAIKSNVPILRPHRERGIEWAKQQPNVALVFDDNGEVIDIEEF